MDVFVLNHISKATPFHCSKIDKPDKWLSEFGLAKDVWLTEKRLNFDVFQ